MEEEKIVSIEERIPQLKEKRKKKANRSLLIYLTLFFFLIALIIYLQSPFSQINHIRVSGNQALAEEEIITYSGLSLDENIWRVSLSSVEAQLRQHPLIDDVQVVRKLPQSIEISIGEKQIIGYVQEESQLHPVLEDGVILSKLPVSFPRSAPLFVNFTDEQYLQRFAKEMTELPEHILNMMSEVHWEPTKKNKYKIKLFMNDGYIVHATIRDFASKMKSYPSIIAQLDPKERAIIHMDVGVYVETFKK